VITGFNTDIERDGVVYHVQTEDKGLDSPLILSLVYTGGEILAAKRTPYDDLIATGFTDEALAERLKRQHRLICAAINAGRIEELKAMGAKREETVPEPAGKSTEREQSAEAANSTQETAPRQVNDEFVFETAAERPATTDWQPESQNVVVENTQPPEVSDFQTAPDPQLPPRSKSSHESAYMVYDSRRPSRPKKGAKRDEELALTILDDEEYRAGQKVTIRVLLQRHMPDQEKPVAGVSITIKVLGTSFRPQIYSVKTQKDGVAIISIDIPTFSSGRAALVINAEAHKRSVELRRVILPAG
jgi:hypothetical protein